MNNKLTALFITSLLALLPSISPAGYMIHIPTEEAQGGSLPNNSITFNPAKDETVEPEQPEETKYRGSVGFEMIYENIITVDRTRILTGYSAINYTFNKSELPNHNPEDNPCKWNAFAEECIQIRDPFNKGQYTAQFAGNTTVVNYTWNTLNSFPNAIDAKSFKTSYKTLYVEQNGEMVACGKSNELYQKLRDESIRDKISYYEQYSLTFICPLKLVLPERNVEFKFN